MKKKNIIICDDCKQVFLLKNNNNLIHLDRYDKNVCTDCLKTDYILCQECNKYVYKNDIIIYTNDNDEKEIYCQYCYNDKFFVCDDCGEIGLAENSFCPESDLLCQSCYENNYNTCDYCNNIFHNDNLIYLENYDQTICNDCRINNYSSCYVCGEIIEQDDIYFDDGEALCEHCHNNFENNIENNIENNRQIHNSDFTPELNFLGAKNKKKALYLGIELETDYYSDFYQAADDLYTISNNEYYYWLKTDGSLSDKGIEICIMPLTINYLKKDFPLDNFLSTIKNNGGKSHDALKPDNNGNNINRCGLHVHINKKYFDNPDLSSLKIIYLFEKFHNQIYKFSRRNNDYYCQKNSKPIISKKGIDETKRHNKNKGRYQAVNLCPSDTIEIRIFRGTLNKVTFLATLEFCNMMAEIAKNYSIMQIIKFTWNDFKAVAKQDKFKNFLTYCTEKEL